MNKAPWPPNCDSCSAKLTEPGAVVIAPPTPDGWCFNLHLCVRCFSRIFTVFGEWKPWGAPLTPPPTEPEPEPEP